MASNRHTIYFNEGVDVDNDSRIAKGYRYALNVVNGQTLTGDNVAVINTPGNIMIPNGSLPSGTNKCIGCTEDRTKDSIIFLNYNSAGYHGIYRYWRRNGQIGRIEEVFKINNPTLYHRHEQNAFNFDTKNLITGINLIDNTLAWTDYKNRPRIMDVERANENKHRKFNLYFRNNALWDGSYSEGPELVNNGGFILGSFLWTLGSGWSINPFTQAVKIDTYPDYTSISQTIAGLVIGSKYRVSYEVTAYTAGFIAAFIGTTPGQNAAAVGTYTDDLSYDSGLSTIKLLGTDTFVGGIDNISVKLLSKTNQTFDFEIQDATGSVVHSFSFTSAAETLNELCDDFMVAYKINVDSHKWFTATNKGQYIQIELAKDGKYVVDHDSDLLMVSPANFYPDYNPDFNINLGFAGYNLFTQYFIDRARWMPERQPVLTPLFDETFNSNNIKNKVFQFRMQYVYFDYTVSNHSAISNIPILDDSFNKITIDFEDTILNDAGKLSLIKYVRILYREHNSGVWKIAKTLNPHEVVATDFTFDFYNNDSGLPVSELETNEPFTLVPLQSKSQEFADNRLFDGGIVEGYDKVDLDASIAVEITPPAEEKLFTIKGMLIIWNFKLGFAQPVWAELTNPDLVGFGGFYNYQSYASPSFYQPLPLQGFVIYAAGTEYYGVSKQVNGNTPANQYGSGNFYDGSVQSLRQAIQDEMFGSSGGNVYNPFGLGAGATDQNGNLIGWDGDETRLWSYFEIKNIPEGKYILRVAGNETTLDDVTDGTLAYQKKSTSAARVGGNPYTEVVIEVNNTTADANGVVHIGRTEIIDITGPDSDKVGPGIKGYLCDKDDAGSTGTFDNNLTDHRISLAEIEFDENGGTPTSIARFADYPMLEGFTNLTGGDRILFTDHNGFFFYNNFDKASASDTPNFLSARVGPTTELVGTIENNSGNSGLQSFRISNATINTQGKTFFNAAVKNTNGSPLPGISAIVNFGSWQKTDYNGRVKIPIYINSLDLATQKDLDVLFLNGSPIITITPLWQNYLDTVDIGASDYNSTTEYDADFSALALGYLSFAISGGTSVSAFKRGFDGQLGVAYYDEADRCCAVCTSDELKLKISFHTEGSPGLPTVSWSISNRPPEWAVKYQWVRTKNLALTRFLQWVVNDVEYIDDNDTGTPVGGYGSPQHPSATKAKIDIQNIGYYTINKHPNAVINFGFEKGDRVRLISDKTGVVYSTYFDFEILNVVGNFVYIDKSVDVAIERGCLVEFYSPRSKTAIKTYFEFGECYPIETAIINNVRQKYHTAPVQDQTYGTTPNIVVTPATGIFTSGDIYLRKREMQLGAVVATDIVEASTLSNVVRQIEDQSISDFYASFDESIGRPRVESEIGKVFRNDVIRFSDLYYSGTETNGLSTCKALNEKQFGSSLGLINKLILVSDDVLKAIFDNSYMVAMYINKDILRTATGESLLAISNDVIPRTHKTERTFGTQHPESIVLDDEGNLFGYDEKQAVLWRSSGNGLIDISLYRFKSYMTAKTDTRKKLLHSDAPAVFDLAHNLYFQSFSDALASVGVPPKAEGLFPDFDTSVSSLYNIKLTHIPTNSVIVNVNSIDADGYFGDLIANLINTNTNLHGFSASVDIDGYLTIFAPSYQTYYANSKMVIEINGVLFSMLFDAGVAPTQGTTNDAAETIGFYKGETDTKNRLTSWFSFKPEMFGRIRNEIVSFVDGNLWIHNNPVRNNFYGQQYVSQIKPITNQDSDKSKVFKQITLNPGDSASSVDVWYIPLMRCPATLRRPNGFESELKVNHFKNVYGAWHSDIKRNKLTPGAASVMEGFINGDFMQGDYMELLLENNHTVKISLFSVEVKYIFVNL